MKSPFQAWRGPPPVRLTPGSDGSTLVFSMRAVSDLVAYCTQYEFEDVITATTGADRIEPLDLARVDQQRKLYKAVYLSTSSARLARCMTPSLGGFELQRDYDLFIAVFNDVYEVFAMQSVANWRERCRKAVCVITELWEQDLPEYLLKSLSAFDRIYVQSNPVQSVARLSGRPCEYLPISVDAVSFCPSPVAPARSIDVLGIGRRSAVTHDALLALARERNLFYYYDTVRTRSVANAAQQITFSVIDPAQHRFKYANLLKRSRYYLASRARANESDLAVEDEMTGRFFEGAASGTIMIGDPPRSGPYLKLFDWPDAVVACPFDDPAIGDVLAALDADPERCIGIRRRNMVQSLLRHDAAYRIQQIYEGAGLKLPDGVERRRQHLRGMAEDVGRAPLQP